MMKPRLPKVEEMNTREEILQETARLRKRICRLYHGYTPVREIERLLKDLEIATQNEFRRLQKRREGGRTQMRTATKANLVDQTGMLGPRSIMHCAVCGQNYSANRGDYFMAAEDHVFEHCGQPMLLAVRREAYHFLEDEER